MKDCLVGTSSSMSLMSVVHNSATSTVSGTI